MTASEQMTERHFDSLHGLTETDVASLDQHRKTEHVLEALRDLTNPHAMVIRDVQQRRVAGREVEPVATKLQGEVNWPAGAKSV